MLQLIGYDLEEGWPTLKAAVQSLAGPDIAVNCHQIERGPWLLKTDETVEDVHKAVLEPVAAALKGSEPPITRKLLALLLAETKGPLLGAHRGFDSTAQWLEDAGFPLFDEGWFSPRTLYIRTRLEEASAGDFHELRTAIWHRFHGCCKPLKSEWFVHTSLPPREVCRYLEPFLPENADSAELLVLHPCGPAVESGFEQVRTDIGWLWENGIPVKHRR